MEEVEEREDEESTHEELIKHSSNKRTTGMVEKDRDSMDEIGHAERKGERRGSLKRVCAKLGGGERGEDALLLAS